MAPREVERYQFGPFLLEVNSRELRRGDSVIPLTGKTFDLLVTLLRGTGRTVTKSELMAALWPDIAVEESNLTQTVFLLRKALGEDSDAAGHIQTMRGQGYRLAMPVSSNGVSGPATAVAAPRTWWKYAAASAALAVLALAAVFIWIRTRPAPMADKDILVLADFTNSTGEPVFDNVLRDALAFQLEQSPFLKALDDGVIREDLKRMRRSPQEHITDDLARDICVREGHKAVLGGSIARLGKSYAIELKATDCQTGATLARQHAEAADKDRVLQSLAKAAQGVRSKLGESLSSIEKLAPPLPDWNVTTGSLEAFQAFHEGANLYVQSRLSEAIPPLQRATEIDPELAIPWIFLANAYYQSGGSSERYHEYLDRAWALRDRVSAFERSWVMGWSDHLTTAQLIENAEESARTYPRASRPQIDLGRIHQAAGEFELALANFQELYRLYRQSYAPAPIQVIGVIMTYGQLDRFDEAKAVAREMFAKTEDAPMLHYQLLWIAYAQDDQQAAAQQAAWFAGKPDEHRILAQQAAEARVRGQLRKSLELLQRAADLARLRNLPDAAAAYLKPDPAGDALLGNCTTTRKTGEFPGAGLDRTDLAALVPVNHVSDAIVALCGTPALAEQAEETTKHWITSIYASPAQVPVTHAAVGLGLGHPEKAIELLESTKQYERGYPMASYIRGLAYQRLKKGSEAAAEFQKILDHRGANWGPLYARVCRRGAWVRAHGGHSASSKSLRTFFRSVEGCRSRRADSDPGAERVRPSGTLSFRDAELASLGWPCK